MKEWLKKLVEDERRNAPSCASLYSPGFHAQLNEEGIRETPHKDRATNGAPSKEWLWQTTAEHRAREIYMLRAELEQRDSKIAELERGSEDNSDSWRDEAVVLDAEVVKLDAEIARLRAELAHLREEWDSAVAALKQARVSLDEHRCGFGTCHCCMSIKSIDAVLAGAAVPPAWVEAAREVVRSYIPKDEWDCIGGDLLDSLKRLRDTAPESWRK